MAKTTYVDILPELEEAFFTGIKSSDRFVFSRLVKKQAFYTKKSVKGLTERSLLPQIAAVWNAFSPAEKLAWVAAGNEMGLNINPHNPDAMIAGWRLFVQDKSCRIKNDMPGVATPSLLHQSWVGNLKIELPADEIKIVQIHPRFYWISKKVTNKKGMYEPVLITEDLALSFKISLNYRGELTPVAYDPFAKFYARFWHSYQGADQYSDFIIPLDFDTTAESPDGWKRAEATISLFGVGPFGDTNFGTESELLGYYIRYDLYFHLKGLTGDLYFDNVKVEHSSQNWVRDPFCKDINQGFTRAFYQIPKHWAGVILPSGSMLDSIYKDF